MWGVRSSKIQSNGVRLFAVDVYLSLVSRRRPAVARRPAREVSRHDESARGNRDAAIPGPTNPVARIPAARSSAQFGDADGVSRPGPARRARRRTKLRFLDA